MSTSSLSRSVAAALLALLVAACSSSDPSSPVDAAAGAGGSGQYQAFAGCTWETSVAATQVTISPPASYSPACVRVTAGSTLTIQASAMHPLEGMTKNGDSPNPIAQGQPSTGYLQDATFTFPTAGSYGFFCNVHGSDTAKGGTMTGVVYVE
jgi:plastocyanin